MAYPRYSIDGGRRHGGSRQVAERQLSEPAQKESNQVAGYTGGSGTNTLMFTYAVQPGDNAADLQVTGLNLPSGATIHDQAGNALSGNVTGHLAIQINTTTVPPLRCSESSFPIPLL
jgi:hypothetical protein